MVKKFHNVIPELTRKSTNEYWLVSHRSTGCSRFNLCQVVLSDLCRELDHSSGQASGTDTCNGVLLVTLSSAAG